MTPKKIFGYWEDYDDFSRDWSEYDYDANKRPVVDGMATEDELIFASYGGGSYDGDAFVLFERNGTLYEVHGSHCSCYELEGQWEPEATTWDAIAERPWGATLESFRNPLSSHEQDALDRMRAILAERGFTYAAEEDA